MSRFTDLIEGKKSPLVQPKPKAKPKAKAPTPKPKAEPKPEPVVIEQPKETEPDVTEATKVESPEPTFKPRRQRKASKKATADGGSF